MHFYKFNIGDYRRDTAHLSRLEHGIYRDLIDWYYLDESPIPLETHSVSRRLRLVSEEDATALKNVLSDFFSLSEAGYRHTRIDADIAGYHSDCLKNQENGKKGGRPKTVKPLPAKEENPMGSESVAGGIPSESQINPNQEPRTKNQEPVNNKAKRAPRFDAQAHLLSFGVDPVIAADWITLRKVKHAAVTPTAFADIASEAEKAGMTLDAALRESCSRGWAGFKACWLTRGDQARASPLSVVGGRASRIDNYAAQAAQARGNGNESSAGSSTERDITGEVCVVA